MSLKLQAVCKAALSIFIVFQLLLTFAMPNPDSIIYRALNPVIMTYGNLFGFNTTWRFFSPNPMIRILEYEVFTPGSDGALKSEIFQYPRPLQEEGFRERFNRKIYNVMYTMFRPDYLTEALGPVICKWHPGAETISFSMRGLVLPSIEKSKFLGDNLSEIGKVQKQHVTDIHCAARDEDNVEGFE